MNVSRRYDLDWLRIVAVFLLIPFHTSMIYNSWDWHIKYPHPEAAFTLFTSFLGIWHMPLFFILAGVATGIALGHRNSSQYLWERVQRLFIPLFFGILVLIPPQVYCERLLRGQVVSDYWHFYPHFFARGIYPEGNLSWHHLWFLAYLFTFSVIGLPLFNRIKYLVRQEHNQVLANNPNRIFFLAIPLFVIQFCLRVAYPGGNQNLISDWANFLVYFTVYCYGFMVVSYSYLWDAIVTVKWRALAIGVTITVFSLFMEMTGHQLAWSYNLPRMLVEGIHGVETYCYVIALLGIGRVYLNRYHKILPYLTQAAFPIYVLHQTVIVILGYYLVQTTWPLSLQFILINIITLILVWSIYDLLIKRIPPLGFLFGIKPRPYIYIRANIGNQSAR